MIELLCFSSYSLITRSYVLKNGQISGLTFRLSEQFTLSNTKYASGSGVYTQKG